ncbi:MAG: UDP-glucose 4-epimerase GalE [Pseudomonadota bacterium]
MATILVTGGAGYVGSHACKLLKARGHAPVAFDDLSTGWEDAVLFGPLHKGDLLDRAALDAAFEAHRPDAVMHFAAKSLVGESVQNPAKYWRNNVVGSMNLLDAMRAHGVDAFVFSSTCAIFGDQGEAVLTETTAKAPASPYGASKLAVESMLDDYCAAGALRATAFRYFNVAGADPEGEIGERHDPETHLIPLVLQAASGEREAISVFGSDYPTPDGTCIRDYIHVVDLIEAHILGIEALLGGAEGGRYNLGTGHGYSVREVIEEARRVTGRTITVREADRRPGDPAKLVSGGTLAAETFGWRAQKGLPEMIADAWAFFEARRAQSAA